MKFKLFTACIPLLLLAPLVNAKIVFVNKIPEENQKHDIYVMDDDGSNLKKITNTPVHEINPAWSPDRRHIAFEREIPAADGKQITNIFIVNADGSNERQLTTHTGLDSYPIFYPDGKRVCFSRIQGKEIRLYAVDLESGDIEILIDEDIDKPDWSPNGRHIVYELWNDILTVSTTGPRKPKLLLPPRKRELEIQRNIKIKFLERYHPKWSPDGRTILYCETAYNDQYIAVSSKVFMHDWVLGTQKALPIPKDWRVHRAVWMGDGKTILLSADEIGIKNGRHGTYNIYQYHIPSNTMTQLTHLSGRSYSPDWVEGALDVSPRKKKPTLWSEIKDRTK